MKYPDIFDLYTDYLLSSFSQVSATGLSKSTCNEVSHDQATRLLAQKGLDQKAYWKMVKKSARIIENSESVLIVDDFIENKPCSTENSLICYHWDHSKNRSVKGINIINFLLVSNFGQEDISLPVAFETVEKTKIVYDKKSGKQKHKSDCTKNQQVRQRLIILTFMNMLKYKYILFDSWYSSVDNLELISKKLKRNFVCAIKSNRLAATSEEQRNAGEWEKVSEIKLKPGGTQKVWLKSLSFPVLFTKQVFTNEDGSSGTVYLITDDLDLDFCQITSIYHKRWKVEESHKSLKQNLSLEKSPTKMVRSQKNHIFATFVAFIRLESLRFKNKLNHFAIKQLIYINAIKQAMAELNELKQIQRKDHLDFAC